MLKTLTHIYIFTYYIKYFDCIFGFQIDDAGDLARVLEPKYTAFTVGEGKVIADQNRHWQRYQFAREWLLERMDSDERRSGAQDERDDGRETEIADAFA